MRVMNSVDGKEFDTADIENNNNKNVEVSESETWGTNRSEQRT
jgi:hypothetical protein